MVHSLSATIVCVPVPLQALSEIQNCSILVEFSIEHRLRENYLGGGTFNLKKPFEVSDVIHDTTDWGTHLDVVDSKMYNHHMGWQ